MFVIIPIVLALLASILYAISYHIDKYLISKAVRNADYRALIVVSTIVAGGAMTLIYLFICNFQLGFDLPSIMLLIFNAVVYVLSLIVYYKALDRDDTTIIAIMFQFLPVFTLLLSLLILKDQQIGPLQLVGGAIITLAAFFLTYEPTHRKFDKKRLVTLAMMIFVSFGYAIWYVIERYINREHDFNQTILWSNIALTIVGLLIVVLMKSYRKSFSRMMRKNGPLVIGLNLINELSNSFAGVLATFIGTLIPVALESFISQGVQPFVVMALGFLITKLFPKIEKEKITKNETIKRFVAIVVCVIGLGFIEFG